MGTDQESGPTEHREAGPCHASPAFPSEGTEGGDRDYEKGERVGRTRPDFIGIPQGCEAEPNIEHDGHQLGESEAEAGHGLSPRPRDEVRRLETHNLAAPAVSA